MALSDEYIGRHFEQFDASFKKKVGLIPADNPQDSTQRVYFYICPLCISNRMGFHQNTLHCIGEFSKDHYPPQNVGGKRTILVCTSCNSQAGTDYDYILADWLQWQAFQERVPNATLDLKRTSISTIPGSYGGKVTVDSTGLVEIDVKPHKKPITPLDKWIVHSKTEHNYTITTTLFEPKPDIIARALIKAAYLYTFQAVGYEFALSEHAAKMREAMTGKMEYPLVTGYLANIPENNALPEGLVFIQHPQVWQTIAVSMPLYIASIPYKRHVIIPIPAPTATGWDNLEKLQHWADPGNDRIDVSIVPLPSYLEAGELHGYTKAWQDNYKP